MAERKGKLKFSDGELQVLINEMQRYTSKLQARNVLQLGILPTL